MSEVPVFMHQIARNAAGSRFSTTHWLCLLTKKCHPHPPHETLRPMLPSPLSRYSQRNLPVLLNRACPSRADPVQPANLCTGGPDVIRKEVWPFYRTISGVRLWWELEESEGHKGLGQN